ncbi:MAG TPA: hypothetical protein VL574_04465, partial [Stellaceae bacterium]|nr:hypothetical protein [Stellaceae bacterium]
MKTSFLAAAVLAASIGWAASSASAQTAAPAAPAMKGPAPTAPAPTAPAAKPAVKPTRLHGTITGVHKDHIDFTSLGGATSTIALMPNTTYVLVEKTTLRSVKKGNFVGVGAMEQADGALVATEVTIFPESMRGRGEGNRPWEMPKSQMTNGTVGDIKGKTSKSLTVAYKGGQKDIKVVKQTVIVKLVPGNTKLLKKGAKVSINAIKTGDASYN